MARVFEEEDQADLLNGLVKSGLTLARPKKGGGYAKCGRPKAKKGRKGYPKCVPAARAARMSKSQQRRSAIRSKES